MDIHPEAIKIHEHGFVHLVESCATDLSVVNAARVSYGARSDWVHEKEKILSPRDVGLISFLIRNEHGTPFEHNLFTFHVRAPIFVLREWHRHRIGWSYNEESARYTKLKPDFYIPDDAHVREQIGAPGRYTYAPVIKGVAEETQGRLEEAYHKGYSEYEDLIGNGIALEIARLALPVATYSQMYATCNARSLMNFLALRNAHPAMQEIHEYAEILEQYFSQEMPVTAKAFIDNEYVAP